MILLPQAPDPQDRLEALEQADSTTYGRTTMVVLPIRPRNAERRGHLIPDPADRVEARTIMKMAPNRMHGRKEKKMRYRWRLGAAALATVAVMWVSLPVASAAAVSSAPLKLGDSKRFDTWTGYEVGRFPKAVVSADFNGDGAPDVAYARYDFFKNKVAVQLNLGDGTMKKATSITATADSNDIAAGDIDGDGDQDIV